MKANLRQIVTEFRNGLLEGKKPAGMCYAVCAPLSTVLSLAGYLNNVVTGYLYNSWNEHYWIELEDETIIDPTASQFKKPDGENMPDVYIGEKPIWYDMEIV